MHANIQAIMNGGHRAIASLPACTVCKSLRITCLQAQVQVMHLWAALQIMSILPVPCVVVLFVAVQCPVCCWVDSLLCWHVQVQYMWQEDGSHIGTESVTYDQAWLLKQVEPHIRFWEGQAAPSRVNPSELWKCHRCLFNEWCYNPANRASRDRTSTSHCHT